MQSRGPNIQANVARGLLARLRRDVRGNALAMMAISLIPISALAGSAVDVARLYVVKVRLQQACDAGALAGRKFMTDSDSTTIDETANSRATEFFRNNFKNNWMQTSNISFTASKTADRQVAGVASVVVPMTLMKMFAAPDVTLNVTCEARYDVADTDIMFVLDTTGSMACKPERDDDDCSAYTSGKAYTYTRPSDGDGAAGYAGTTGYAVTEETLNGKNISRIQALRVAVPEFYATVAANVDASTHIRYGFVTYSSMVNAGKAVIDKSSSYLIGGAGSTETKWTYQSRSVNTDYVVSNGAWTDLSGGKTQTQCTALSPVRDPVATKTYFSGGTANQTEYRWQTSGSARCQYRTNVLGPQWKYQPVTYDVSSYVGGNAVTDPSRVDSAKARWWGCLEERDTTAGTTSFNTNSLPNDLNPDLIPSSASSQWRPYWPDVEYVRPSATVYPTSNGDSDTYQNYVDPDRMILGKNGCAKPVQRLKEMTAAQISAFVNAGDFKPVGGTYHDIGMIWGVRMLSPLGIFASDTSSWSGRPPPKRVIVFFTDGAMSPSNDAYGMYGVEQLDQRVTGGDTANRITYHNARFLAECAKAKAMGMDVWTVAIAPAPDTNLQQCASSTAQSFNTTTGIGLSDVFKKIAKQVAMLRLSK